MNKLSYFEIGPLMNNSKRISADGTGVVAFSRGLSGFNDIEAIRKYVLRSGITFYNYEIGTNFSFLNYEQRFLLLQTQLSDQYDYVGVSFPILTRCVILESGDFDQMTGWVGPLIETLRQNPIPTRNRIEQELDDLTISIEKQNRYKDLSERLITNESELNEMLGPIATLLREGCVHIIASNLSLDARKEIVRLITYSLPLKYRKSLTFNLSSTNPQTSSASIVFVDRGTPKPAYMVDLSRGLSKILEEFHYIKMLCSKAQSPRELEEFVTQLYLPKDSAVSPQIVLGNVLNHAADFEDWIKSTPTDIEDTPTQMENNIVLKGFLQDDDESDSRKIEVWKRLLKGGRYRNFSDQENSHLPKILSKTETIRDLLLALISISEIDYKEYAQILNKYAARFLPHTAKLFQHLFGTTELLNNSDEDLVHKSFEEMKQNQNWIRWCVKEILASNTLQENVFLIGRDTVEILRRHNFSDELDDLRERLTHLVLEESEPLLEERFDRYYGLARLLDSCELAFGAVIKTVDEATKYFFVRNENLYQRIKQLRSDFRDIFSDINGLDKFRKQPWPTIFVCTLFDNLAEDGNELASSQSYLVNEMRAYLENLLKTENALLKEFVSVGSRIVTYSDEDFAMKYIKRSVELWEHWENEDNTKVLAMLSTAVGKNTRFQGIYKEALESLLREKRKESELLVMLTYLKEQKIDFAFKFEIQLINTMCEIKNS